MHEDKCVLAIDLGTSSAKVALVTVHGRVLGWESESLPLHILPDGGAEQNPDDWWSAIITAGRRLLAGSPVSPGKVVAVCASTQGEGTVPVDRDGHHLMNAMTWLDTRGARHVWEYVGGAIRVEGYNPLKALRWIRITGGLPAMSGKDLTGHMLYIKYERPEIYDKTYKFLNVLDTINLRLTGEFVTTPDSVFSAWVTDHRDPSDFHYHEGLLRQFPIDREKLPEIKRCIDVIGTLRPEVADELGLDRDVKVVAGSFDVPAVAVGAGAVEDYATSLSIGTSTLLSAHVPFKKTDATHYIASMPCTIPGKYLLMAAQDSAGGNLTFLRDNIIFHRDAMLDQEPGDFYRTLDQVVTQVPPGSNGLIYTPWLYGERAPIDDPTVRAGLHNLSLENTRADIVRAVLEGVALNTKWLLGPSEKFIGGREMNPINVVSGGAQSDLWCQIHADVLNRTIRQVSHPIQANARGAAFMAAVGLGFITFSDIPACIEFKSVYEPNPQHRALYDELLEILVEIYKQNRKIYARLNRGR